MSLRKQIKARGLFVLFIPAILGFVFLRPTPMNPPASGSVPDAVQSTNASSSTSAWTSTEASVTAAIPTTAAKPTPTAAPTPRPNNYIWIPWRSQFDGSPYAGANCGPASLGMVMSYYGEWWSTAGIRKSTNAFSGLAGFDDGTDWPSLEHAAETRNFKVFGLYDSAGAYRKWTVDDLVKEIAQEHPVLLLVLQRSLPGHTDSDYYGDHYIIFLGLMADGRVVYHDSAFPEEIQGAYRIMSQETLLKAWRDTSVGLQYTAMSLVWEHSSRKWDDPTPPKPTSSGAAVPGAP